MILPELGIDGNRTEEKQTECWNALKIRSMENANRLNIMGEWKGGLVDSVFLAWETMNKGGNGLKREI